ncbi:hypothetical protein BE15_14915 [Sorangium cellulosum]|uniref:Uncharacterized protein n=1 Tax=Sorangium cellulosum TaxID=56 RepID=A0A150Q8Y9_SORCE|nr:hypothetical protein BE15_14915 [Sorangium cellulosum]
MVTGAPAPSGLHALPAAGPSAITSGFSPAANVDPNKPGDDQASTPEDMLAGYNPASDSVGKAADPRPQTVEIEEAPEPPSESAPDPEASTPIEQVTWIVDKAPQARHAPAALDGAVPLPPPIDALVRTLVEKSVAWSSPRTQADKREAIALVTELLQQLGMDAKVVDRGEQGDDGPDDEHSACTCVR